MGKCPFSKICRIYNPENRTCSKDNGDYYAPGRKAGCGRDFEKNGKNGTYYKQQ